MPTRARTAAAVAALLLAGAPAAEARPAESFPAGYAVSHVLDVVTRYHWSVGADGTYRVLPYREVYSFAVVFPTVYGSGVLSASSLASASRR